jgi:predicted nucleotide-binding protein
MADDSEDWVSASEAVKLVKRVMGSEFSAQKTICTRAHAGLIRSRAARFVRILPRRGPSPGGPVEQNDVEVPRDFWWAGGEAALEQNWQVGDFETWSNNNFMQCKAYGVSFLRSDIMSMIPSDVAALVAQAPQSSSARGSKIFIGHGHSDAWRALKDFIVEDLHLTYDEFNRIPTAGKATVARLQAMLDDAAFAFLVLTGEDKLEDKKALQARLNVVHEAGLFQAHLGFEKAIILLEDGCEEFSNIHGLGHISFRRGSIKSAFQEVRDVLVHAGITPKV